MNEGQVREAVLRVLSGIAPEVDLNLVDPAGDLREQVDIDSVDFLNFAIGLHKDLGVEIPDADVTRLATLNGCVAYLVAKMNGS
jgi:acyl carrier protein